MKIKATQDFQGSLNGFEIIDIVKDTVLDIDDRAAKIFLDVGFCKPLNAQGPISDKTKNYHAD